MNLECCGRVASPSTNPVPHFAGCSSHLRTEIARRPHGKDASSRPLMLSIKNVKLSFRTDESNSHLAVWQGPHTRDRGHGLGWPINPSAARRGASLAYRRSPPGRASESRNRNESLLRPAGHLPTPCRHTGRGLVFRLDANHPAPAPNGAPVECHCGAVLRGPARGAHRRRFRWTTSPSAPPPAARP